MRRSLTFCLVLSLALLGGCQQGGDNRAVGGITGAAVGGVAGALAGRALGRGPTGAIVGAVVGAAAGALIGSAIAARLDSPQDRALAEKSTSKVLEGPPQPGQRDQWQSPETPNTRGTTELTRVTDGGSCRNVREIAIIRGEEVRQESRYCRGQDGRWVLQA